MERKYVRSSGKRIVSLVLAVSLLVTVQGMETSARSISENTMEKQTEETIQCQQEVMEGIPFEFVSGNSVSGASVQAEEGRPVSPVHHCQKDTGTQDYTEWDYVYFGSYPQSEIKDAAVIAAIENAIAAYGIRAEGGTDVWVDGVKYRRMSQKHMNAMYDKIRFADCSYRYFKWERIKWKVLAVNEDSLFVVADKALDNKSYHDKRESITWENCNLRSWLNENFYHTAFDRNEQSAIVEQAVKNGGNPLFQTEGGNDTRDYVSLLSVEEVTNKEYGFCDSYDMNIEGEIDYGFSRMTYISDYAYVRGAMRSSDGSDKNSGHWWLRSPGNASNKAARVGPGGYLYRGAGSMVSLSDIGVCPVLHIKRSSNQWLLEDDGLSGAGGEGGESLPDEWMEGIALEECRLVVYDKETKEPVSGAAVTIEGKDYTCDEQGYVQIKPDEMQTKFSDFQVSVFKEGYETSALKIGKEQFTGGAAVYLGLKKKAGVTYLSETLESCDKANSQVTVGGEVYDLAEDFVADIPEAILKNNSSKEVVCTMSEGKIVRMEALEDIIQPQITICRKGEKDNRLIYNHGLYQGSNEESCIVRIYCGAGEYPDSLFADMEDSQKQEFGISLSSLEYAVEQTVPIRFNGSAARKIDYTKDLERDGRLYLGDTLEEEIDYQIEEDISPEKVSQIYRIETALTATSFVGKTAIVKSDYEIPAFNMDKQRELHNNKQEDPDSQAAIRNSIQAKAQKELAYLCSETILPNHSGLKELFSEEQIQKIKKFLYLWTASLEICGKIDYSGEETDMTEEKRTEVAGNVLEQLGIRNSGSQTGSASMTASKILEAAGKDGETVQIEFFVEINTGFDGKSVCSKEKIEYDILTGNPSDLPIPASGFVNLTADINGLSENIKLLAESLIKASCIENQTAEQTAMLFTSETLRNIFDLQSGSFSNKILKLDGSPIEEGLKEVVIQGPVDVYLYDMSGNLCGIIRNNVVDESYQEVAMFVEGDKKILYLTNDSYKIQLEGNGTGSMVYSVKECDGELNELRFLEFQPLSFGRGDVYKGLVLESAYSAGALYALLSEKGDVVNPDRDTYEDALVKPVDTEGVSLDNSEKSLTVGETFQLNATVTPADAANQYVSWESSNEEAAVVDTEGKVTAKKAGNAVVKVITREGKFEAVCKIAVKSSTTASGDTGKEHPDKDAGVQGDSKADNKVTNIAITAPSKKLAAGKKVKLTVKVTPENASNKSVAWSTSNKKYANVDKNGRVTIKKSGIGKTVTITATAKDGSQVKAVYKFRIMKHAVKSIKLKASKKSLKAGKSMTINTTVRTTGKNVNRTLKWKSSNSKYATVNKKGKVTAKKAGKGRTVTITAASTDGSGKKAKIKIKIQ